MERHWEWKLSALTFAVPLFMSSTAEGADYNSSSMQKLEPSQGEVPTESAGMLPDDPAVPQRARVLMSGLLQNDRAKRYEAAHLLAAALETEARASVTAFFHPERKQLAAAQANLDSLFQTKSGLAIPDKMRGLVYRILEDRFRTRSEYEPIFADLEFDRRDQIVAAPATRATMSRAEALKNFRSRLAQALFLPLKERAGAKAFWNATENSFQNLETDCGHLKACSSDYREMIEFLVSRRDLDRSTAERLHAIFNVRLASRDQLRDWLGKARETAPWRTVQTSRRAMPRELMSLGFVAADNMANRWAESESESAASPKFYLITLFFFSLGVILAAQFSYRG